MTVLDLDPIKTRLASLHGVRDMFTDDATLTDLVRDDMQALLNELDAQHARFLATLPIYEREVVAAILDTTVPDGWRLELDLDDDEVGWEHAVRIYVPTEGSWTLCRPLYRFGDPAGLISGWRTPRGDRCDTLQDLVDPMVAARTPRHDPTVTRGYGRNGYTATIKCSCREWEHTITARSPIRPAAIYRHHKMHRETHR